MTELKSFYLKNRDENTIKTNNPSIFKQFYNLVY